MTKVTIKKEGSHYVVNVGGTGMSLAYSKGEAKRKAEEYRKQVKRLNNSR